MKETGAVTHFYYLNIAKKSVSDEELRIVWEEQIVVVSDWMLGTLGIIQY